MDISTVINKNKIDLNLNATNKDEVLNELAELLLKEGVLSSKEDFIKDVYLREAEGETGIGGGIAIPHGKSKSVLKTSLAIGRTKQPIEWETLDDAPITCIILFAVRDVDSTTTHVRLLGEVAGKLADDDLVTRLLVSNDPDEIIELFSK